MRWGIFVILAVLTLIAQTTLVPWMAIRSIWPNLLFIVAVHYALWGPWPEAAIAAWILGVAVDLQTLTAGSRIGLYAFSFALAAMGIMRIRTWFYRDKAVTHFFVTLLFCLLCEALVEFYRYWRGAGPRSFAAAGWPILFTALYTAACAPYLHWILIRMGRWTGLRTARL